MKIIGVLEGTGWGVSEIGFKLRVRYELLVSESQDGEGSKTIGGWVLPTFGVLGETLKLEMQEGIVEFVFVHSDGTVQIQCFIAKQKPN